VGHQTFPKGHQAGGVKSAIVDPEVQGVFPAQVQPDHLDRFAVGDVFHKLQQDDPGHENRLETRVAVVRTVQLTQLLTHRLQGRIDFLSEYFVSVPAVEKILC